MHALVPLDSINIKNKQILTRTQPFEMFYTLNCQNLCSDFHEDLEFKFSWGITAMIQRFTGKAKGKSKALLYNTNAALSPPLLSPIANGGPPSPPQPISLIHQTGISQDQISLISRFAMASIGSQGTVGGLLVAGFVSSTTYLHVNIIIDEIS